MEDASSRLSALTRQINSLQNSENLNKHSDPDTSAMAGVLVVGATRGLGAALATKYAQKGRQVFGTAMGQPPKESDF